MRSAFKLARRDGVFASQLPFPFRQLTSHNPPSPLAPQQACPEECEWHHASKVCTAVGHEVECPLRFTEEVSRLQGGARAYRARGFCLCHRVHSSSHIFFFTAGLWPRQGLHMAQPPASLHPQGRARPMLLSPRRGKGSGQSAVAKPKSPPPDTSSSREASRCPSPDLHSSALFIQQASCPSEYCEFDRDAHLCKDKGKVSTESIPRRKVAEKKT